MKRKKNLIENDSHVIVKYTLFDYIPVHKALAGHYWSDLLPCLVTPSHSHIDFLSKLPTRESITKIK